MSSAPSARLPRAVAALAAAGALVVGLVYGTWVAGGSDSYCYVEQAERWAAGTMLAPQHVDFVPPWPDPWLPLAPTGFVPSTTIPGGLAPICPSGLSLTMVPFRWIGGPRAVYIVVPLLGALAVWGTFLLGSAVAGPVAGALAAWLLAFSPIFLFQLVQPMSDVAATAWWTLAVWLVVRGAPRDTLLAGAATAAAVLTRPVLAPLGAVLVAGLLTRPREHARRVADVLRFCAGAAPGAVALAAIQWALYGSPLRSGYGSPAELFSAAHVWPNLGQYARWALETETPIVLLAGGAIWLRGRRWASWVLLGLLICTVASYLPYVQFDDWSYLRFLLPGLPFALVLTSAVVVAWTARLPRPWPTVLVVLVGLGLAAGYVRTARARYVFDLHVSESKFRRAGEYVQRRLPPHAVVLTIWHSGSVRYYGRRLSIAWDAIAAGDLQETVDWLERRGHEPYFLLEASEEARFRERFAPSSPLGGLDWPPMAAIGREVRVYRPADRGVYFAGGRIATDRLPAR